MTIIDSNFKFKTLTNRNRTDYIILHHRGGNGDIESINKQHKENGWSGVGYHFYIRKNGKIYRGRPQNKQGANCVGYNNVSIGVCFEGNYHETDKSMPSPQLSAGRELIQYLQSTYPNAKIKGHRDLYATACPGQYFPFKKLTEVKQMKEITTVNDIVYELSVRGIITDKALWLTKLEEDRNAYWLAKKTIDYFIKKGI